MKTKRKHHFDRSRRAKRVKGRAPKSKWMWVDLVKPVGVVMSDAEDLRRRVRDGRRTKYVFVVSTAEPDSEFVGVFSTEKKARAAIGTRSECCIRKLPVNTPSNGTWVS